MTQEITWSLPGDLLETSIEVMRPHGRKGNEGLALWLGKTDGNLARVTHLVSLSGDGFRTSPLQLRLSWNAMSKLTELADKIDAYLVGQIHSHPGNFIDLSEVDQVYGIRCQDGSVALSVNDNLIHARFPPKPHQQHPAQGPQTTALPV